MEMPQSLVEANPRRASHDPRQGVPQRAPSLPRSSRAFCEVLPHTNGSRPHDYLRLNMHGPARNKTPAPWEHTSRLLSQDVRFHSLRWTCLLSPLAQDKARSRRPAKVAADNTEQRLLSWPASLHLHSAAPANPYP